MSTATTTDEALAWVVARQGDSAAARAAAQDACRDLYDRHSRKLLAFLSGRLKPAALDDTHQEVWQRVWQHLPTGFKGGSFRSWLYAIARNCVTDHLRRKRAEGFPDEANLPDHRHRPAEEELVEAELHQALARCLQQLERQDALLADLFRSRIGGEGYDEICARTRIPADRAYRAFHQAKAQLQACVERTHS